MPTQTLLTPRKSPIQARSTASVKAIREATVQVLLAIGKQRLTTARVAQRAGVSIGTLYQYFPNKSALLHHALKHHLDSILALVEQVCRQQHGQPLEAMVTVLISSFLDAKLQNPALGTAFYGVAADLGGHSILQANEARTNAALSAMLASAPQPLTRDPAIVASMLQGAMAGVSRRMLEIASTPAHTQALREELVSSMRAYIQSCVQPT